MDVDVYSDKSDTSNNPDALVGELEDPAVVVKIGTTAAKIAFYNFEWRYVTLVMYNTMLHIGVESFLQVYNQSVALKLGKFVPRHRVHVPQFVIFGQDIVEVSENVNWLIQNRYDNTGMFIVICSSANYNKCSEIEMFQTFSRLYMPNVIFLKAPEDGDEPMVLTYYPVLPGECRNNKPSLIELSNCDRDMCFKNMFPEKYGNLHKCSFIVSTLEQPPFMHLTSGVNGSLHPSGADGDIIKLISEILNATLVVTTPEIREWGHYKDNNWTGSLGDVFNKRAHASSCAAPLTPQIHGNFQISFNYASIDIVWAAKLPALKPSFEKLLYPLKMQTRIALCAMFFGIIFINAFMNTKLWADIRRTLNIGPTNISLFFYSWLVFFGMPLLRFPSKSTMRMIVISWIWFCYIIRTAYQAALVGSMKLQLYEDYLQSFNMVIKKKYPYGGLVSLRDYYSEDEEVFSNWAIINFNESYTILDELLNGTSDFVIALDKEFIVNHIMRYNGTKRLQIIPGKIVNSPAVLYFKKFAPLRTPVSRIISSIVEGGIVDMIYSNHLERGDFLFHHEVMKGAEPLKLSHVKSTFLILGIGWAVSILYFFIEVLSKKIVRKEPRFLK
ncbi:hypothetical protein ABMA27_000840 [Loxostege sticticalis]|uniref:Ionotropic glutamate receptor C-terminal domain-containing protein n=1 Tax=Loxostege sticticalis TaxID=481309 RepID=A0ABR3I0H7_LOXSC